MAGDFLTGNEPVAPSGGGGGGGGGGSETKAVVFPTRLGILNNKALYLNSTGADGGEAVDLTGYDFVSMAFELEGNINLATFRMPLFASMDSSTSLVATDDTVSATFNFDGGRFALSMGSGVVDRVKYVGTNSRLSAMKVVGFLLHNGGGSTPSSIDWGKITNKPSFDYIESSAVEQDVSESQDKIPSSAAVSSDLAEAAAVAAAANVATEVKVTANTGEVAANKAANAATEVKVLANTDGVAANKAANAATDVKVTANTDGVAANAAANAATDVKVTANTEGVAANKVANAATEARIDNLPTGGGSTLSSVDWAHVTNKPDVIESSDIEQDISESQDKIPSSAAVSSGLAEAEATATAANAATEAKVLANTYGVSANTARINNLPTGTDWDDVTNKPSFDYVATSRVEQDLSESSNKIPSSAAVSSDLAEAAAVAAAANAATEAKVLANTEGVAANKAANAATEVRIDSLPTAPTDIGWDQVTNKPSFEYVALSDIEQDISESQDKIPSSAAVSSGLAEVAAANAATEVKVTANTVGVAANAAANVATEARIDNLPTGGGGLAAPRGFAFPATRSLGNRMRFLYLTADGLVDGEPLDVSDYTFISITCRERTSTRLITLRIPYYADADSDIAAVRTTAKAAWRFDFSLAYTSLPFLLTMEQGSWELSTAKASRFITFSTETSAGLSALGFLLHN